MLCRIKPGTGGGIAQALSACRSGKLWVISVPVSAAACQYEREQTASSVSIVVTELH